MLRLSALLLLFFLCLCAFPAPARSQNTTTASAAPASVEGFNCSANRTYPCQAYALYRAGFAGVPLDLAAIGDLFAVSRFMVAHANNLSTAAAPVPPHHVPHDRTSVVASLCRAAHTRLRLSPPPRAPLARGTAPTLWSGVA